MKKAKDQPESEPAELASLVGERIRKIRKEEGLSLELFALRCDMNAAYVEHEVIDRLARAFYPAILACWNSEEGQRSLVGAKPLHLLTQTVPSLKSPTGAFIASQTLIFRRKQIIRTHLLSETSSDYFCLVRVARIELTAS